MALIHEFVVIFESHHCVDGVQVLHSDLEDPVRVRILVDQTEVFLDLWVGRSWG